MPERWHSQFTDDGWLTSEGFEHVLVEGTITHARQRSVNSKGTAAQAAGPLSKLCLVTGVLGSPLRYHLSRVLDCGQAHESKALVRLLEDPPAACGGDQRQRRGRHSVPRRYRSPRGGRRGTLQLQFLPQPVRPVRRHLLAGSQPSRTPLPKI